MKRIAFHTLGCKLNYAETAEIGKQFTARGYSCVGLDEQADVVVINTCSVTAQADRDCRQIIRKSLRRNPDAFIAVVGCYSQLQSGQAAAIDGVDLVLGTQEKFSLVQHIVESEKKRTAEVHVSCIQERTIESASSAGFEDRTRAFLKIQDGCDYQCAYCTVPLARGGSRSVDIDQILLQAREAVSYGYKEIVLTGVNVGDFGRKKDVNLTALLQRLVQIDGLVRIRISSIEPNLLTDELLEFWVQEEKLCKHWHIPLQSGSEQVLRMMKRRYRPQIFAERVHSIISRIPLAGIGTDVIVGFPGEDNRLFEETHAFLRDLPVSYFHIFSYSERAHTAAVSLNGKVSPAVKMERSRILRELGTEKRHKYFKRFIGMTVPVLFESEHPIGTNSGLTGEYVRVCTDSKRNLTNTIVRVTIDEAGSESCRGTIAEPMNGSADRIAV